MSRRSSTAPAGRKDATRLRIEKMEAGREQRRRAMQERKQTRKDEEERQRAIGNPGDVDFIGLVQAWRDEHADQAQDHATNTSSVPKICICVRKRPISDKERAKKDHDSITCFHPNVTVHNAKFKVDGITKYIDHTTFKFDHAFHETVTNQEVYEYSTMPLIDFVCDGSGGRGTVFAYGQTGSGKTYTMEGIQTRVAEDLFYTISNGAGGCIKETTLVSVAYFEIYGGYVQDLLNKRRKLKVLEDGNGEIVVTGLQEFEATNSNEFLDFIVEGNKARTTHSTEANDTSSRSHAICQIMLRDNDSGVLLGKLSLVDLAGSERGSDTKSHNSQRRNESAEINTSLLSLKECIRALDMNKSGTKHVPYRGSKLTLILKDCFTSSQAKTTMIATVSPGASSADHSLNTLRYADRIKEQKVEDTKSSNSRKSITPLARKPSVIKERKESLSSNKSAKKRQEDWEKAAQALFEQEEDLLNTHMSNISESAQLLTEEGRMLQQVQQEDVTPEEIETYAKRLEEIIERKIQLVETLEEKMASFRKTLQTEEELSKRIPIS
mmetsp:Transcript_14087/g.20814  ORF Transcript_14087/g.20814 Transcript_14087/m.20814 type:complete len:552 (-) Transcript_14087:62-1717(-)